MDHNLNLEKLKYPVGTFHKPENIGSEDIDIWIFTIEDFPTKIKNLTNKLSTEALNYKYRPNGWSIKQVVHHCADSHMNCLIRFKLALTESIPTIKPYEEDQWALIADGLDNNLTPSIQILEGVHARWTLLLKSFSSADFAKQFLHPASGKVIALDEALGMYAWHCNHHLAHIEQALFYKGMFHE
jgi:hypothetical protein